MPQPEALNTRIRRSDLISVDCCPNKSPAPTNPQQNILQRPLLTGSIITVILNKPKLITVVCCVDQWNNSEIFTVGLCCADICAEATTVKSMTSTMTTQPDYFQHKKLLNKVNLKSETKRLICLLARRGWNSLWKGQVIVAGAMQHVWRRCRLLI